MQRPIVLIVTDDAQFENTAMDAVLETRHGLRRARNLAEAIQALAQPSRDIALALVDLNIDRHEGLLRPLLEGRIFDFPVLAVADDPEIFFYDRDLPALVNDYLIKPVAREELRQKIVELCAEADYEDSPHLVHL